MKTEALPDEVPRGPKEWLLEEVKEIRAAFVYLLISFSLLSTMKALVLAQQGIDEFLHCYLVALVHALALAKLVVLAQKLPFMERWKHKPLLYAVIYQSMMMTICLDIGAYFEDKIFMHHHATSPHPVILMASHQIVLMLIFIFLFIARGIDKKLGSGVLHNILLGPR